MRIVKVLVIDPFARTITEETYDASNYRNVYKVIGAEPFTCVQITDTHFLFLDDNGFFREHKAFFTIEGLPYDLVNKGMLVAVDKDGDTEDVRMTLEELKGLVRFKDTAVQPPTEIYSVGPKGVDHTTIGEPIIHHRSEPSKH